MKKYLNYKQSNITWLTEIPFHWEVLPNIALFEERIERGFINDELLSVTITRGIIKQTEVESKKDSSNEDKSAYKKVRINDIAYNKMRMWQGAVGYSKFEGIVSPAYVILKLKKNVNPKFYHYLFRTPKYIKESYRNSYGICDDQLSLRYFDFKRMYSIVPPREEQDLIVDFIEAKEAKIQKFIANKRRTIELLKEQKASIINRVVTRGLDVNVPLKSTGVYWLGKVPKHWKQIPIDQLGQFSGGSTPNKSNNDYWGGDIPWVSPKDMKSKYINSSIDKLTAKALSETSITYVATNSLLIVVRGMILARKIPVAINSIPVTINQDMKAIRLRPDFNPEYIFYLFSGLSKVLKDFVEDSAHGTKCLRTDSFFKLKLPIPPLKEQFEITSYLDEVGKSNELAISYIEKEIELIEEYRATLIDAAVTGKIDVRQPEKAKVVRVQPQAAIYDWKLNKQYFGRTVIAAEATAQLGKKPDFGHIMLTKTLYLAKYHARLDNFPSNFTRQDFGPFDRTLLESVESQMFNNKWFKVIGNPNEQRVYLPLERAGGHENYFTGMWQDKKAAIQSVLDLMSKMNNHWAEIVATLFAAWNDFLIESKEPTNQEIIDEVLFNWHPKKQLIKESDWRKALERMKEIELVPTGFGEPTRRNK